MHGDSAALQRVIRSHADVNRRQVDGACGGSRSTYEEQLEWEFENNIDLGGPRNAFVPDRSRASAAAGGSKAESGSGVQSAVERPEAAK